MSRDAAARFEAGRYRVRLNEALACVQLLKVCLARLLTPEGDGYLAPTRTIGCAGGDIASWLATGAPRYVMPEKLRTGEPLTDDERAQVIAYNEAVQASVAERFFAAVAKENAHQAQQVIANVLVERTRAYRWVLAGR